MEQPYVPFYKPYGMSDEEYSSEVRLAESRLAEWEIEQEAHAQMESDYWEQIQIEADKLNGI